MYNGRRSDVRHKKMNRWFFYIYYPAHMGLLLVIQASIAPIRMVAAVPDLIYDFFGKDEILTIADIHPEIGFI